MDYPMDEIELSEPVLSPLDQNIIIINQIIASFLPVLFRALHCIVSMSLNDTIIRSK